MANLTTPLNKVSNDQIYYLKKTGNYLRGQFLQMWVVSENIGWQVLANKKLFKTAVLRNFAKRRLRELLRALGVKANFSGLISFKNPTALSKSFSLIKEDYKKLQQKI